MTKETKKISRGKPYDIIDMEKAVQEVKKGSSVLSASKMFKIPYATLHSRVTGKYDLNVKPGPSRIFNAEEEKELVDRILELSKRGFPVTKEHLLDSVQCIVRKTLKITPFTNGRPSKHWYKAFMRRHPQLSEKVSQSLNKSRANVTENNLKNWFSQIKQYLLSNNAFDIEPDRVFNLDETAFLLNPKCGKVLVKKGEKSVYNVCHNDKECYTALIGGNASGQLLPTMVVFSYERIPVLVAKHFPEDFVLGKSESGWMTSETFFSYVANHLYQWCLNNKIKFPIVVYVDGHSSHLTKAFSDFCVEKGIILIALFPNATHIMQPMDVGLFHPLKCSYKNAVRIWRIDNNGQFLTKVFFASVLKIAVNELDIKKIFKSGFQKCGLYPFSENAIDYSKFMKNYECDNKTPQREQHSENLCNVSHEEPMNFIELNINPAILSDFKANECIEWKGDIEFTELFNFWLRCKNKVNDNLNTEKSVETLKETIEISSVNDLENIDIIELPVIAHGDISNEEIVLSNIIEVSSTSNTENLYVVELPCIEDNVIDNDFIDSSTISDVCEMSDTSTTNHKILDDKLNINIDKDACDKVFVDKDTDVNNDPLFISDSPVDLSSKNKIGLSSIKCLDLLESSTLEVSNFNDTKENASDNKIICESKIIEDPKSIIKSTKTEIVFGTVSLQKYLFYPEMKSNVNGKKKSMKEKLPPTATSTEWRAWHQQKAKEKEEKERKKVNLKEIILKKKDMQKRIKDLQQKLKESNAKLKLMEIQMINNKSTEEKKLLEEKLQDLKQIIKNDTDLYKTLLKDKQNYILEEKKIKTTNCEREPLKTLNI